MMSVCCFFSHPHLSFLHSFFFEFSKLPQHTPTHTVDELLSSKLPMPVTPNPCTLLSRGISRCGGRCQHRAVDVIVVVMHGDVTDAHWRINPVCMEINTCMHVFMRSDIHFRSLSLSHTHTCTHSVVSAPSHWLRRRHLGIEDLLRSYS